MKKLFTAALLASVVTIGLSATAADAREGCGRGGHRGPAGHCRVNRGGPVVVAPGLIIGNRYDRGYWDGHRYWQNRYRYHNGWRYR